MYPELRSSRDTGAVPPMYLDKRVEGLGDAQVLDGEVVDQEVGGIRSSRVADQVVVRTLW